MSAKLVEIANALVTSLNDGTFSEAFTAVRLYQPIFQLDEMETLHLTVVAKSVVRSGASRSKYQYDYSVDVAIQKRTDRSIAALDAMVYLTEEIADHLSRSTLAGATLIGLLNEPVVAPDHLDELGQFTTVLTFTYRGWR